MKKIFCAFIALVYFITAGSAETTKPKKRALLIGIQYYKNYSDLSCCHGDVDDMKKLLRISGFEDDCITELKDDISKTVTASDIAAAAASFRNRIQNGDKVVFFFSGHGYGDENGNNYLIGNDGHFDFPEFLVKVQKIQLLLKEKQPAEIVMIIDACRTYTVKGSKDAGVENKSSMHTGKNLIVTLRDKKETQSVSGRTIIKTIYSASEGQQSYEYKDKNNGVFTYYLTYLLEQQNAGREVDIDGDGIVTFEDLVDFASVKIKDYCKSEKLGEMEPVYQTEGAAKYPPFQLFTLNRNESGQMQSRSKSESAYRFDEQAALAEIKRIQGDNAFINEDLPEYSPDRVQPENGSTIPGSADVSAWQIVLARQNAAKDKKKKNETFSRVDAVTDIVKKYELLSELRIDINALKYSDIKEKFMMLLEPVFQKVKELKEKKEGEIQRFETAFAKDISDIQTMLKTDLDENQKKSFLLAFIEKYRNVLNTTKNDALKNGYKTICGQYGPFVFDEYVNRSKNIIDNPDAYKAVWDEYLTMYGFDSNNRLKGAKEERNVYFVPLCDYDTTLEKIEEIYYEDILVDEEYEKKTYSTHSNNHKNANYPNK